MEFSLKRAEVLSIIKKNQPISVADTARLANLSIGNTIYRYLEELQRRGLITMRKEKGKPIMLNVTSKANAIDLSFLQAIRKATSLFG